ncbi:protein of unknown function [Acidithiobacillus ferrivorans]|uniref:Uncharacterized protein n=1 Tax=Acidithiobacillus ferrivorans TaxID=160808 RepID=A0ABY1MKT5_9PROT|nr:protein of unknown function [Acidithiobacillus ferrivorans]
MPVSSLVTPAAAADVSAPGRGGVAAPVAVWAADVRRGRPDVALLPAC